MILPQFLKGNKYKSMLYLFDKEETQLLRYLDIGDGYCAIPLKIDLA